MDLSVGDTLYVKDLSESLQRNQQFIFNTSLFQKVEINIKDWDTKNRSLNIEISVVEDLYIYPIPIFALADRNFNVWWKEYNASLRRTSYDMRFYDFNMTGNADRLKLLTQFGYTKRFEIGYDRPNINRSQTLGWNNSISYQTRKEVNYTTEGNKQLFISNDKEDQLKSFRYRSTMTYRPRINKYHSVALNFFSNSVADTISKNLNPAYYLNFGQSAQKYFGLRYSFRNDLRNFRTYPTKGSFYQAQIIKDGLGIFNELDIFRIEQTYAKYFSLSERMSFEGFSKFRYSINRDQPAYANYRAIGFNSNTLRGYELYVIDALDFVILKSSLRYQIFNKRYSLGRAMPFNSFKSLPIQLMLTINNDVGYANDPFYSEVNALSNQWLWGGGLGFDLIFYNDYVCQIEYNINQLSEKGLFLKVKLPF